MQSRFWHVLLHVLRIARIDEIVSVARDDCNLGDRVIDARELSGLNTV